MTRGDTRKTAVRQIMARSGMKYRDAAALYEAGADTRALGERIDALVLDNRSAYIAQALGTASNAVVDGLLSGMFGGMRVQDRLVSEFARAFGNLALHSEGISAVARSANRTVQEALEEWALTTQSGNIVLAERLVWLEWYRAERAFIVPPRGDAPAVLIQFDRVHGDTYDYDTEREQLSAERDTLAREFGAPVGITGLRRQRDESDADWNARVNGAWLSRREADREGRDTLDARWGVGAPARTPRRRVDSPESVPVPQLDAPDGLFFAVPAHSSKASLVAVPGVGINFGGPRADAKTAPEDARALLNRLSSFQVSTKDDA